jgi:hypothetical protein
MLQFNDLVPLISRRLPGPEAGELPPTTNATVQNIVWFKDRFGNDKQYLGVHEAAQYPGSVEDGQRHFDEDDRRGHGHPALASPH